ncbi:enoyl-ACP reductase FabV [Puniceicoccus vermicola]|uniref:Enoyl-[acyl-carrier-protein] reductase [NADH] n=1 Tax=Puniceicoccus vermicola TaxID=388746 RepID=A0A7X1B163_9BACT|nr:enoyl-ACP reductase FabV [Puniceicoccus vermicola]MBC2603662.1 trans-2-enoyl-CoA reductase family protein [Puniceicoccus vermicola]
MIIEPKVRGFVCVTSHPEGCAANVKEQIEVAQASGKVTDGPKRVLVIGSSTGYGLSSRIQAAFGCGADTFGVFFERPASNGRPASAGYYNAAAFEQEAQKAGLYAGSLNGDAFSDEMKEKVVERLKKEMGPIDLVVYSLASPRRTDPRTGETFKSCLKPIGQSFSSKTVDTDKDLVHEIGIEPAGDTDVHSTIKVMGGEDWERWMECLAENDLLADNFKTIAYSYIGPEVTWPIYKNGTIGKAKEDLDRAASVISEKNSAKSGKAYVAVNKAVVTQASSAIPVVPLYISILFKIMKEQGTHEGCIEQIVRLFRDRLYGSDSVELGDDGRIHVDDLEMKPEIQEAVAKIWPTIETENLRELSDYEGYQSDFLKLFGFGVEGIDYTVDVDPETALPGGNW